MMLIRPAEPEDARAVAEIHVEAWRAAYESILPEAFLASLNVASRQEFWTQFLIKKKGRLLVAMDGMRMLGWINTGRCRDDDALPSDAEIWALYVSPAVWSKGVGRQLWESAQCSLREAGFIRCSLWVLAQNVRAIRFYQAAGFERDNFSTKSIQLAESLFEEVRFTCHL